jgi:hypothetical protein
MIGDRRSKNIDLSIHRYRFIDNQGASTIDHRSTRNGAARSRGRPTHFLDALSAVAQLTRCFAIIDASISFIDVSMLFDLRSPITDLR